MRAHDGKQGEHPAGGGRVPGHLTLLAAAPYKGAGRIVGRDEAAVMGGTKGELDRSGGCGEPARPVADGPEGVETLVEDSEEEVAAVGGPAAAARRARLRQMEIHRVQVATVGGDFPDGGRALLRVSEGEAQTGAVAGPLRIRRTVGKSDQLLHLASVQGAGIDSVRAGIKNAPAIGRKDSVVGNDVAHAAGRATDYRRQRHRQILAAPEKGKGQELAAIGCDIDDTDVL